MPYSFWDEIKNYAIGIGLFIIICAGVLLFIGQDIKQMFIMINPSALIGVIVIIVGIALFLFFSQHH